jgi:hypothetical protein
LDARLAFFRRERFRQDEEAIAGVEQAGAGGYPERKARIVLAEPSANGRTDYEADAKGRAQQAERLGALFGLGILEALSPASARPRKSQLSEGASAMKT